MALAATSALLAAQAAGASTPTVALKPIAVSVAHAVPGHDAVEGTLHVAVPKSWRTLRPAQHDPGVVTLRFAPGGGGACVAGISISTRLAVTRESATGQVAHALAPGHRVLALGRGRRPHGAWGLDEVDSSAAAVPTRSLYAIGVLHVRARESLQVRVLASFTGPCSDTAVRSGQVPRTLRRVAEDARFAARR